MHRTFSHNHGIMANVWGAKYHEADEGNKIWRLVVPKTIQSDPNKFEQFIARQSGQDSGFRIRKKSLWTGFVQYQEDILQEKGNKKFIFAENTGLLDTVFKLGDRASERYVFNSGTILNHQGKKIDPVDVVVHATLSLKVSAPPLLKPISMPPGARDIYADIIRVSTPGDNFYPCNLGLASGIVLALGKITRGVTEGQLPVVSKNFSHFSANL